VQFWTVIFQPFNNDAHDLFMLCIVFMCQSYHVVFYYCCSIIVRFFIQFFVRLFCFSLFIVHSAKEKDSILILDCIPGILIPLYKKYPLYVKYLFIIIYASQINILPQTASPITIIDVAGYMEPIFSKS
jgi:hypothetical protein